MKIVVTGGAGFIGSHIVDAYIRDGHAVLVIDDLSTGRRENLNPQAEFFRISITDPAVEKIMADFAPDIVNHHAAQIDVRRSVADPMADAQINILGTVQLLEAARQAKTRKIIFASSGGTVYGEQTEFPAAESHPIRPLSPYGIAKLAAENYLQYYSGQFGLNYVALRYANVYGPRQNSMGEAGVVAIFSAHLGRGEPVVINGDGNQTRDYIYVGDVVRANQLALQPDVAGAFNIGTGIETTVNQVYALIAHATGFKGKPAYGPAKPGETRRSVIDGSLIRERFGFVPQTNREEGIRETVAWFRKK